MSIPINDNQSIDTSLEFPGDGEAYTFSGKEGDLITAFVDNLTNTGSRQVRIRLLDTDGMTELLAITAEEPVVRDTFAGQQIYNQDAEIRDYSLPNTGTFTLLVDGVGDVTGNYTIGLTNIDENSQTITDNQGIDTSLEFPGDGEAYTFSGKEGDLITAFVDNLTSTGSRQVRIRLLDTDGMTELLTITAEEPVVRDTFAGQQIYNQDAEIRDYSLPNTGTFTFLVDGVGDVTGNYTINLNQIKSAPPNDDENQINTRVLWREEFNQNFDILNNNYLELQKELNPGDGSTFLPIFKDFPNDIVFGTQLRQENSGGLLPFVINDGADGATLRLQLDTFNPTAKSEGDSYLGTSIKTKDTFNLQDGGLAFEASLRLVDSNENSLLKGIIAGFFSYTPIILNGKRDEIDFEILSNFIDEGQNNNTEPSIFTNVFNDDNFAQRGDFSTVNLGNDVSGLEGIDLTAFNKYRIEWNTDEIKWLINDVEIRSETNNIPDGDMSVYLNIWANGFPEAVDESFLPASNAQSNQTFYYDVDYLQLERFGESQKDTIINIDNFSNADQITFNGGSTISGNVLRLVPNNSIKGSAFYFCPINIDSDTSFSTSFQIDINRINGGGDGFTFILQNDSRQDNALGGEGGNLGYSGIAPSLAIQFDVFQNTIDRDTNDNHVGINLNGSKVSVITATPSFDIDNIDNPLNVWIDYEGRSDRIEVFLSETDTKPSTPLLEYEDDNIDLFNLIGDKVYLGFTAGQSSGTSADIDILNWQLNMDANQAPNTPVLNDPLIRFQNSAVPGTYLFAGKEEAENVRENFSPPFVEEGEAFKVSLEEKDGLVKFNRFRNNNIDGTYILATEAESVSIRRDFGDVFTEEGTAFYAYGEDFGIGEDVIRFRNRNNSTYIFALCEEAQQIRDNFSDTFAEEGVAFEV